MSSCTEESSFDLKKEFEITSAQRKFIVDNKLGEGGFGAVFLVKAEDGKAYAMKVEKETKDLPTLSMEVTILRMSEGKSHFLKLIDYGHQKKDGFFFMVVELAGKSLSDLMKSRDYQPFSLATALGVGDQCLQGLETLHNLGFIHRDIKPDNISCGFGEKEHVIFLLDFGLSRQFLNKKHQLKAPRGTVNFRGTVKFASVACHRNAELGPKDDLESWFYTLLDLLLVDGLPWEKCDDRAKVYEKKEELREDFSLAFNGIEFSKQLMDVLKYCYSLQYHSKIDYKMIRSSLRDACRSADVCIDDPYDWERIREPLEAKEPSKPIS